MNPIVKNPHFYFNSFLETKIILKIQPLALPPAPITERKIICFCCPILRRSQLMKEERIIIFFFLVNWALCWPPHWMHRISIPKCVGHHFRLMAEGGMNGGNCLYPFSVHFGLPGELVCKIHCLLLHPSICCFVYIHSICYFYLSDCGRQK